MREDIAGRRIVFLDFDGVLNNWDYLSQDRQNYKRVDPERIACLNRLLKETGAVVVISSTWRKLHPVAYLKRILKKFGFVGKVIDITPDYVDHPPECDRKVPCGRGHEIQAWMDTNAFTGPFVILDDDSDMAHLTPKLVQTSMATGLTDEHVDRAIAQLRSIAI